MSRCLFGWLLLGACGPDQVLVYDLEPIQLGRAPVEPGGAATGGLLAAVSIGAGIEPLLVDSAFPVNSLARAGCASPAAAGWTYSGNIDLHAGGDPAGPVRASFRSVGLFDICPGTTGDAATQPAGVVGGPLLANFSVGLVLLADPAVAAQAGASVVGDGFSNAEIPPSFYLGAPPTSLLTRVEQHTHAG